MADIIRLLPDSIANQIAAGEVIQRPSSVVKELLENALDAGGTLIQLIIKDAGKTSIQVIDNGKGMSETDIRMAFERHATSKITSANDLFAIKTMGFRGEALASIAAIAHVETISRMPDEDLANRLCIEGTEITKQDKVQSAGGTNMIVKNLFYNVPARRKFLKSDPVELRQILDEFHRVVLANPDISFSMHHNGNEVYHLPKTTLKLRIIGVAGKNYNEQLVPVSEQTDVVTISGFVGKAEAAKRTQGDQFIFVNKRFIKSNYLNHAIRGAFEDLVAKEVYPSYFLFLDIDPANIDINVHPTKTEIKFEDERMIYNYLRVTIKHALGQYSISSLIDFGVDQNFVSKFSKGNQSTDNATVNVHQTTTSPDPLLNYRHTAKDTKGWEEVYKSMVSVDQTTENPISVLDTIEGEAYQMSLDESLSDVTSNKTPYQLHKNYIIYQIKSGMMMIDQQAAHERILYENYLATFSKTQKFSQKELFPITVDLDPAKAAICKKILDKINALGFEMSEFGQNTFVVHGTPVGLDNSVSVGYLIEEILNKYTENLEFELGIEENLARSLAASSCIKHGRTLDKDEMNGIIDQLFGCVVPFKSPSGKKCFITIELDELSKRFNS